MPCDGRESTQLIARAQLALLHDPQVRAGAAGLAEALDHLRVAEAQPELGARQPRLADLELDGPGPPALADHGAADVDALDGEVLAEHAGRDVAAELGRPPRRVLARVRVHGLVGPAVHAPVGLIVAREVDARDPHAALHRRLADRAHERAAAADGDLPRPADVHRDDAGPRAPGYLAVQVARLSSQRSMVLPRRVTLTFTAHVPDQRSVAGSRCPTMVPVIRDRRPPRSRTR